MTPPRDPERLLPLTHLSFHVLLALADADLHGYGLIKDVRSRSAGHLNPGTGTLYTALQRMLDEGLIAEAQQRPDSADDDQRRRYYTLTEFGRRVAEAEASRLDALVAAARQKQLVPAR